MLSLTKEKFLALLKSFSGEEERKKSVDDDILDSIPDNSIVAEIPEYEYPENYDPLKPTIILLDDNEGITKLFEKTITKIKSSRNAEDCQFLMFTTNMGAFVLQREIEEGRIGNVLGAVLDITIGGFIIDENGVGVTLDGIDAYAFIKEKFPKAEIRFFTAHSMNRNNIEIFQFIKKYEDMTGEDIEDITFLKNPFTNSREEVINDILLKVC